MIGINHASFLSFIRTIRSFIDYSLSHNSTVTEENKRTTSPQNRHVLVHWTERSEKDPSVCKARISNEILFQNQFGVVDGSWQ